MRRVLLVALLLYLIVDYCDPGIPGVFFFDNDAFFVDAAVQPRGAPLRPGLLVHDLPVLGDTPETRSDRFEATRRMSRALLVAFVQPRPTARDGDLPVKTPAEDS